MCFETSKNARAKIAKTDITCWKVLCQRNLSPFKSLHYLKGVVQPSVKLKIIWTEFNNYHINEGYHSHHSEKIAKKHLCCLILSPRVVECIIPKGTKYYSNKDKEYVSETIMRVK